MIVPDTIEVFKGYKALLPLGRGELMSPTEPFLWPARQRAEAVCQSRNQTWSWIPVPHEPRRSDLASVPQPTNELPEGWSWSWEVQTHLAPAEHCRCGIYVVTNPRECVRYIGNTGFVVGVALWGKVIPAATGARGQYAYPTELLVPQVLKKEAGPVGELYSIPVRVLDHPAKQSQALDFTITPERLRTLMGLPGNQ